jgi:hypothetical protein
LGGSFFGAFLGGAFGAGSSEGSFFFFDAFFASFAETTSGAIRRRLRYATTKVQMLTQLLVQKYPADGYRRKASTLLPLYLRAAELF